ncbi:MAG: hypothetical protein IVW54_13700 [Candidatus Binataceae bacterium]|nr:hypothetical protein [Candidatus Binataceae bacterium]
MTTASTKQIASLHLKRLSLGIMMASVIIIPRSAVAGDIGSAADLQSIRAIWQKITGADSNNRLIQIVVDGDYAIAETHNVEQVRSGMQPNPPFAVLYRKYPPGNGNWQYQTTLDGAYATCGLVAQGIPAKVAAQFVASVPRLAADQRTNPNWGCRPAWEHGRAHRPLSGGY